MVGANQISIVHVTRPRPFKDDLPFVG